MSNKKSTKAAEPKKTIAKQPEPAKKQAKTSFSKGEIKADSSKKVKRGTMHPNYREISIVQTDGTSFITRSTYKNNNLKLDIDIKTHPAWTKETSYVNTKNSEVAKFNNKFAGLTFGIKPQAS